MQTREALLADLARTNGLLLRAEEAGDSNALASLITENFTIIRANGVRQNKEDFLKAAPGAKELGRSSSEFEVRMLGECVVVHLKITTLRKPDGTVITRHFWNTRVYMKQGDQWKCAAWQVTEIQPQSQTPAR